MSNIEQENEDLLQEVASYPILKQNILAYFTLTERLAEASAAIKEIKDNVKSLKCKIIDEMEELDISVIGTDNNKFIMLSKKLNKVFPKKRDLEESIMNLDQNAGESISDYLKRVLSTPLKTVEVKTLKPITTKK